jgi:L-iditol 2-dehydrogenase
MKACIFNGPGNLTVENVPDPKVNSGEVLIKTAAASLCYSDIRVYKGEKSATIGVVQGHEIAGTVIDIGNAVHNVNIGERVAICPIIACGGCYFCIRGLRNRCLNRSTLGYQVNGGLAEYVLVPGQIVDLGHVLKLPEGLTFDVAAMTEPYACALYSLEACKVVPGGSLVIIGAGPMGLTHLMLAKAMGVSTIVISDLVDSRLKFAKEMGADIVINSKTGDLLDAVKSVTKGIGADAVIVTVGNVNAIEEGFKLARPQGYVNIFGGSPPGSIVKLDPNLIHYSELFIMGTQNANPEHYTRALEFLSVLPNASKMFTHRFSIDNAPKAFQARLDMDGLKAVIDF